MIPYTSGRQSMDIRIYTDPHLNSLLLLNLRVNVKELLCT